MVESLVDLSYVAEQLDLPIEGTESILISNSDNNGVRAEIKCSLLRNDELAIERIIREIKNLITAIAQLDAFLIELTKPRTRIPLDLRIVYSSWWI